MVFVLGNFKTSIIWWPSIKCERLVSSVIHLPFRLGLQNTPIASQQRSKCPGYDTKQSDGEASVMLELWGMQSTHLLRSLPGPLWP